MDSIKVDSVPIESFMPQTATCYHNSLTLKWILIHHVHEIVFVPARTFGAWVALPLCSLYFFRLVFHALKVMMQTDASWASNRARSCQSSFSGAELPCYYITRLPNRFRIEMRRDETRAFGGAEGFWVFSVHWIHRAVLWQCPVACDA